MPDLFSAQNQHQRLLIRRTALSFCGADAMSGCTPIMNENGTQKHLTPADSPDFMELLMYA